MKNTSQYIPLGILYPVSPGFLRFLRMWSEWIFTTMPINHKAKPKEQTRLLWLIAGQSEESHAQLNRTLPSFYGGAWAGATAGSKHHKRLCWPCASHGDRLPPWLWLQTSILPQTLVVPVCVFTMTGTENRTYGLGTGKLGCRYVYLPFCLRKSKSLPFI